MTHFRSEVIDTELARMNTVPSKSELTANQNMFWWTETLTVNAGMMMTGTLATVADGKRLLILGIDVSTRDGTDSEVELFIRRDDGVLVSLFRTILETDGGSQQRSHTIFPEGSITIGEGTDFVRRIYNYGGAQATYNINVFGITIPE